MKQLVQHAEFGTSESIIKIGALDFNAYILKDHMRIFENGSVCNQIGLSANVNNPLYEFCTDINRHIPATPGLLDLLRKEMFFESLNSNGRTSIKKAILPDTLIKACQYIAFANSQGFLRANQLKVAKAAEIIVDNWLEIDAKIDYACGFELFKTSHKEALLRYKNDISQDSAFLWIKAFPDVFFENIFKFYQLEWRDLNKRVHTVAEIISDLVFSRLEQSLLEELRAGKPKMKYRKPDKPEQFPEHPRLSAHILAVTALMNASGGSHTIFNQLLNKTFPKQSENNIIWPSQSASRVNEPQLDSLNAALRKILSKGHD